MGLEVCFFLFVSRGPVDWKLTSLVIYTTKDYYLKHAQSFSLIRINVDVKIVINDSLSVYGLSHA